MKASWGPGPNTFFPLKVEGNLICVSRLRHWDPAFLLPCVDRLERPDIFFSEDLPPSEWNEMIRTVAHEDHFSCVFKSRSMHVLLFR